MLPITGRDPMVTAPALHSGHNVVGGNRGTPLDRLQYWNCTGVPALWCSWLSELFGALFEGGGSLLPAGFNHLRNKRRLQVFVDMAGSVALMVKLL